jgi:hypothetical protein
MGIGLTTFIRESDVRERMADEYPNPGADPQGGVVVEHGEHEDARLGTALDLLLLFWLDANAETVHAPSWETHGRAQLGSRDEPALDWPEVISDRGSRSRGHSRFGSRWTPPGEGGGEGKEVGDVDEPDSDDRPDDEWAAKHDAQERARRQHRQFRKTGMNIDAAIDAALVYSGVDWNAGLHDDSLRANTREAEIVAELRDLFGLFREQARFPGEEVVLAPDFGQRSHILEGHGDFITDGLLVDVKTTAKPRFTDLHWRQLLGYYLLNDIHRTLADAGEGTMDVFHPEVTEVGIYFARFGELQTVDMTSVLGSREEYERFRAWFVDRAIEANRDGRLNYDSIRAVLTDPYDYDQQSDLSDFF